MSSKTSAVTTVCSDVRYTSACACASGILLTAPDIGEVHLLDVKARKAVNVASVQGGSLCAACYDPAEKSMYVADQAYASIMQVIYSDDGQESKGNAELEDFVKDYEGQ